MTVLLSLLLSTLAHAQAGPEVAGCYDQAQSRHPTARVAVQVDGAIVQGPTASLARAFDAIAAAPADAALSLRHDAAGARAMRHAMRCLLDRDIVTWSMVRLHEHVPELAVRPDGLMRSRLGDRSILLDTAALHPEPDGSTLLVFRSKTYQGGRCLSVGLAVESVGWGHDLVLAEADGTLSPNQKCEGKNCTQCGFDPSGNGCAPCGEADNDEEPSSCNHTVWTGGIDVADDATLLIDRP